MKETDTIRAQMRKGMLEFCIMLIIEKDKAYTSEILKQLKAADLLVVEGTVYPLLSRLKLQGLLEYVWEESKSGPPRKYYTLTDKGHTALKELKQTWKTLSASITSLTK